MKPIYLLPLFVLLFSCRKENKNFPKNDSVVETGIKKPTTKKSSSSRLNTGFNNITANSNGTYSGNGIVFSSITYRSGDYETGEAVNSIGIQSYTAGTIETYGPAFVTYQPTMDVNTNFREDFEKYKAAWDKAISGQGSVPMVNDYIKNEYTNPSLIVTKGIVIRDHNSPSTFSIAPGTYQPIVKTSLSTGPFGILGELLKNGYVIDFKGYFNTGYIEDVVVYDSNSQNVGVQWFTLQSSLGTPTGYNVTGSITLANGSTISINDFIDGF